MISSTREPRTPALGRSLLGKQALVQPIGHC